MRYEQKQITKDDGRYLVFYHFPDSANQEQTRAFQSVETQAPPPGTAMVDTGAAAPFAPTGEPPSKDNAVV